ncbi:MAG TPA: hypothetical protein VK956_08555, partial [Verrucomicrobium sp.]|nr:hypothetical protein [Verrucomicrobium sp.]
QRPMKREGSDDLLVRLPSNSAARTKSFPVRFVYEIPSPEAGEKMGWMGGITVAPPTLTDVTAILQTQQALYVPESHEYTKFKGPMTLSLKERGWGRFRGIINSLIPSFGPQFTQSQGDWTPAPSIPDSERSTFDFQVPTQGRNYVLHRLGAPAATDVSYRSRGFSYFLESLVFVGVLALGIRRWHYPMQDKFRFLVIFGVGGLLLTGLLSAANAQVAKGAVLATAVVAGLWAVCAFSSRVRRLFSRWGARLQKSATPPVTVPVVPPLPNQGGVETTPAANPAAPSATPEPGATVPEFPQVQAPGDDTGKSDGNAPKA